MNNGYDNLVVDINYLHADADRRRADFRYKTNIWNLTGIFRFLAVKLLTKIGIFEKLIDAGIIRGWFEVFKTYWVKELQGRPISIHDFYFLMCSYRVKFRAIEVVESSSKQEFSYAWQRPENIYSTFNAVYKNALNPTISYGYSKYIKTKSKVLEYGCGLAPIAHSFIRYFPFKQLDFSVADIKGFPFHYAKYSLGGYNVKYYDIEPYKKVMFDDVFDVIFLMTVFEHLPNPDEVVIQLTEALRKGGILFFDYCKSSGAGLDTKESVIKRKAVLDYIAGNYKLLKGQLNYDGSMGLTVALKL